MNEETTASAAEDSASTGHVARGGLDRTFLVHVHVPAVTRPPTPSSSNSTAAAPIRSELIAARGERSAGCTRSSLTGGQAARRCSVRFQAPVGGGGTSRQTKLARSSRDDGATFLITTSLRRPTVSRSPTLSPLSA